MFCPKCGKELDNGSRFCENCGFALDSERFSPLWQQEEQNDAQQQDAQDTGAGKAESDAPQGGNDAEQAESKKRKKTPLKAIIIVVICAAVAVTCILVWKPMRERQFQNHMEAGRKYMFEEDYEEAVAEFTAAIGIDPKAVDSYILLADAYKMLDDDSGVEETYSAARDMIQSEYDSEGTLPNNAMELYLDAIEYYGEAGDQGTLYEIEDEILPKIDDKDDQDEIVQAADSYEMNTDDEDEDQGDKDNKDDNDDKVNKEDNEEENEEEETMNPSGEAIEEETMEPVWEALNEDSVIQLLSDFISYDIQGQPVSTEYKEVDDAEVYRAAAWAITLGYEGIPKETVYRIEDFNSETSASNADGSQTPGSYYLLPAAVYEEEIEEMFGTGYSLEDFTWDPAYRQIVEQDGDGNFYIMIGEGEIPDVITIERAEADPTADNTYAVLAEYSYSDESMADHNRLLLFRLRPDEESEYGCVVAGVTNAGSNGEVDEAVLQYFDNLEITADIAAEENMSGSEQTVSDQEGLQEGLPAESAQENELNEESVPEEELNEESVMEELQLFEYWADYILTRWYLTDVRHDDTVSAFETIGPAQAYILAGIIMRDHGEYEYDNDYHAVLPMDKFEEDLRDLFGLDYNADDFDRYADELSAGWIKRDDAGQLYVSLGDYGGYSVEVSIEDISDTPDEDGNYEVLARYDEYDANDTPDYTHYMLYRIRPDEDSKYGCVIVGMVPAGYGSPDIEISEETIETTEATETAETAETTEITETPQTNAYSWVIEPIIEADDINYAPVAYYCTDYSGNESYRQMYSESEVIEENGAYGLIDMNGFVEIGAIYDSIQDAGNARMGDYTGFILSGGDIDWVEYDGEYLRPNLFNDETGEIEYTTDADGGDSPGYFYYNAGELKNANEYSLEPYVPSDPIPVKQAEKIDNYWQAPEIEGPYAVYYNGSLITDFIYDACGSYSSGLMAVSQDGKWGYINEMGEIVIPIEYDPSWTLSYYSDGIMIETDFCYAATDGYVALTKDGEWELRDTDGNLVISPGEFEEIRPVYEGQCWVMKDGKWGVIRLEGSSDEVVTESGNEEPVAEADNEEIVTEAVNTEWQQLYADYIEQNHIGEASMMSENGSIYRNYELVYINNDDVPELSCFGTYNAAGNPILYIQNGKVKAYDGNVYYGDLSYTERQGYISYWQSRMGYTTNTLAYLDENNELTILGELTESYEPYEESYLINKEQVTKEVYDEASERWSSFTTSLEWKSSGISFADDSVEAVEKLRSGNF